jgi:hypothetical protein
MGLIKEPRELDFMIQSTPWTDEELRDFSALIQKQKQARIKKIQTTRLKREYA